MGQSIDYLIVGQGIAGSLLARALLLQHKSVTMVDDGHRHSSSIVSAGIVNPITGQRLALTPQFDEAYQVASSLYRVLSEEYHQPFFVQKPILRILRNQSEQHRCDHLLREANTKKYVSVIRPANSLGEAIDDPFGSIEFSSGGYCQTKQLLLALRKDFKQNNYLCEETFDPSDVTITGEGIQWLGDKYQYLILCEGYQAKSNPWFSHLPFNFAKGEILHISMDERNLPDAIINQTKWCVPLGQNMWAAGANYNRADIDLSATEMGAKEIIEGLNAFIRVEKKILAHHVGVRPVIIDQMPVIGFHPTIKSIGIFNGFGSKGFLMAPWLSNCFVDLMMNKTPLPLTISVERFNLLV